MGWWWWWCLALLIRKLSIRNRKIKVDIRLLQTLAHSLNTHARTHAPYITFDAVIRWTAPGSPLSCTSSGHVPQAGCFYCVLFSRCAVRVSGAEPAVHAGGLCGQTRVSGWYPHLHRSLRQLRGQGCDLCEFSFHLNTQSRRYSCHNQISQNISDSEDSWLTEASLFLLTV